MASPIGFIGLGILGLPMAERLSEQGVPLVVWNRTPAKAEALLSRGAQRAGSPWEVAEACEVVLTVVADPAALREVALPPRGLSAGLRPAGVHLDMSTVDPATTRELAAHHASRGRQFVHAPVLGNRRHAAAGELLIFAGGAPAALRKCQAVFDALGRKTWTWDQPERATCVKLACNLLLGGMVELLAESFLLASRAGADPRTLLEIIGGSALAAPMFHSKGQTMAAGDFAPSFYLRHMVKDLDCAARAAEELGAALPAARALRDTFAAAARAGFADRDYSAVLAWLEREAGLPRAAPAPG